MNNAKMWLVVSPTVGIPLFLGAVAVSSFAVHVAVVSNTSWVSDYLSGQELGTGDKQAALATADPGIAKASYVTPAPDGGLEVTIILPDGTQTKAVLQGSDLEATDVSYSVTQ